MGHEIYAYDRENEPQTEVAYLRRNAWNEINKTIYLALDITERYGGVYQIREVYYDDDGAIEQWSTQDGDRVVLVEI